jgi:glycosyltransferase involved in cell wall biosynthesis
VDPEVFRPSAHQPSVIPTAALRIVSVGDFRWLKAHEYSVRTVAALTRQGVPAALEIIGGDPGDAADEDGDRQRVEHAIAREGVRDYVKLTGPLSSEAVYERLQAANVLLHSSLTEGVPTAVLEAMACGLPVVVSDCGGVTEAVRDGVEGFVVPMRGVREAADALRVLYQDQDLRVRMGEAGRERVQSHFSLKTQLDDFLTMYRALHSGATRSSLPTAAANARQLRLLSVGPMSWTQGFDDAMQAVRLLLDQGIDCRQRIFGQGRYLDALWFVRRQLDLERFVELRAEDLACPQLRRQLEWADALVDCSLRDPPLPALAAAARAAGVEVVSIQADPRAVAEGLIAIAATRGLLNLDPMSAPAPAP